MSQGFDAGLPDAEFGLTDDLEIACEYICPACRTRREIVLKDSGANGPFPCPCGGFALPMEPFSAQVAELTRILKNYGK
ncbi:hypothetical protein V6C53_05050 [Desulfocurvibacter africanus]|uniref:hypothetical protein n=1 Tax=Desulfocurvibacter africanus TaxID=873 RepID=UPI002FDA1A28